MKLGVIEPRTGTASAPTQAPARGITASEHAREVESRQPGWAHSRGKRAFDVLAACILMVTCAPVLSGLFLMALLRVRGCRMKSTTFAGRNGRTLRLLRFQTNDGGLRLLARLPDLWHVLRGQLSLIGPAPTPASSKKPVRFVPGLFCVSMKSAEQEELLMERISAHHRPEYRRRVLDPIRNALDDRYMRSSTLRSDLKLLAALMRSKITFI